VEVAEFRPEHEQFRERSDMRAGQVDRSTSTGSSNAARRAGMPAPTNGNLSSPFFGEYRSLAGFGPFGTPSTYNRKIDIQLRFQF
jgi:hypothetical protein